jgi:hypothetical protein
MELFALVHDSGAGGGAGPVSDHYVGRLMEKVAMKLLDAPCTRVHAQEWHTLICS